MVVNTFATTDFYDEIKPDYYVIADPGFFHQLKMNELNKFKNQLHT